MTHVERDGVVSGRVGARGIETALGRRMEKMMQPSAETGRQRGGRAVLGGKADVFAIREV